MAVGKVLIFGRGYLSAVTSAHYAKRGIDVAVYGSDRLSLLDRDAIRSVLEIERPDFVVNTSAYTDTKAAELPENRAAAFALNVQAPCAILEALLPFETPWVHFSTGMMFDGVRPDGKGWTETDAPHPENYYSLTKAFADGALLPFAEQTKLIIGRIHLPVSSVPHPRNFLNRLGSFQKAIDVKSSITVVDDILPAIDTLLEREACGLYNLANPGTVSAYEMQLMMLERGLLANGLTPTPLTLAELNAMGGAKQAFPLLSAHKIEAQGIALPDARESLGRVLDRIAASR